MNPKPNNAAATIAVRRMVTPFPKPMDPCLNT